MDSSTRTSTILGLIAIAAGALALVVPSMSWLWLAVVVVSLIAALWYALHMDLRFAQWRSPSRSPSEWTPLTDVARRTYEVTRGTLAAGLAERNGGPDDTLHWYCVAILERWPVFGKRPPSEKMERVELGNYRLDVASGVATIVDTYKDGRPIWTDLSVKSSEVLTIIEKIKKFAGAALQRETSSTLERPPTSPTIAGSLEAPIAPITIIGGTHHYHGPPQLTVSADAGRPLGYDSERDAFVVFRLNRGIFEFVEGKNVSSVSDNGVGDFTITFGSPFRSTNIVMHPVGTTPAVKMTHVTPTSVSIEFDERALGDGGAVSLYFREIF